jgi:hypothetical protein
MEIQTSDFRFIIKIGISINLIIIQLIITCMLTMLSSKILLVKENKIKFL